MKFGCRNKDHSLIWAFSVIVKSLQTFVSSSTQQVTNPDTEQQTDMKQRHFHVARWQLIIKAISWVEQLHHLTEHDDVCAVVKVLYHMLHTHTVCLYSCAQPFISIFPSKCFDVLTFFEGCTWSWTRKWTWAAPGVWGGGSAWRGRCQWLGAMGGLGSLQHYIADADQIPEVCKPWRLWPSCQDCAQTELSMPQGDTYI